MKRIAVLLLMVPLLFCSAQAQAQAQAPEIITQHLPDAMVGVYYNARIKADGDAPLYFTVAYAASERNDFPRALKLSEAGVLSGIPEHPGTLVFTVRATNNKGSGDRVMKLRVLPFDESQLSAGGLDSRVIGLGFDPIAGVSNGPNGGRVAMHGDKAYFLDPKGYLYEAVAPFKKAALVYKAREYAWLDTTGDMMYYYHRYLSQRAPAPANPDATKAPDGYVIRIASDPIGKKGRATLLDLRRKDVADLAVTDKIALYIQEGLMYRVELAGGSAVALRAYHQGRELTPDHALPFNGYAYFRDKKDAKLYRMALDGQVATQLTQVKAEAFTLAEKDGETLLYFADAKRQVHVVAASGGEAKEVSGIRAGALNADKEYVYFTNAGDKYKVCRFATGTDKAETLADTAAGSVYVFDDHIAFEARKGKTLYILPKAGGEKPVKLGK